MLVQHALMAISNRSVDMRVLVTWGSKRGGTEGIGRMLAEALREHALDVVAAPAAEVRSLAGFDAVIVGGGLYATRWVGSVRRFVSRHAKRLRQLPVWLFSSGPLDDSADREDIAPTREVATLAERIGARGHVTFGGYLAPDAHGFPASAMAKTHAGDWRNPQRIRSWAAELAAALPHATPGTPVDHPGRSVSRWLAYGVAGWAVRAAVMAGLLALGNLTAALAVHAVITPLVFVALARRYFHARGAREPLPTAVLWTGLVALLDLAIVAGAIQHSLAMFTSIVGTWLPFALAFLATWATGGLMATMPWPTAKPAGPEKQLATR
jgi:menaquinone-dependent protoporphyrinogen oxidase